MRAFAILALLAWTTVSTADASDGACMNPQITVNAEGMNDSEVKTFTQDLRAALKKVCEWWGPTFDGAFAINIENSRGPSMALVPAWRGERGTMPFRTRRTLDGRSALVHEATHVFAPNANRFIAEGLAVYAEEYLSDRTTYPAWGNDMHATAKAFAATIDLPALEAIVTPRRLQIEGRIDQREGYIAAGSFVRFLIETRSLETFRKLYALTPLVPGERIGSDPNRWQTVYGVPFADLQKRWVQFLESR